MGYRGLFTRDNRYAERREPVSAATTARAEWSLGRALPLRQLAFYRSLHGVELRWRHRERRDLSSFIHIVPLEVMVAGPRRASRATWDDTAFEEISWFDHFEEEDPKSFKTFRQLEAIEFIDGVSTTTLRCTRSWTITAGRRPCWCRTSRRASR